MENRGMKAVRESLLKLDPKDREPILLTLDLAQSEIEILVQALEPFAKAADKAEANQAESERFGNRMSDEASPGWGIKIKHLKIARATVNGVKANGRES